MSKLPNMKDWSDKALLSTVHEINPNGLYSFYIVAAERELHRRGLHRNSVLTEAK